MTSYRRSIATIGLSPVFSQIKGDIGRKSQFFPPPCILRPTEGVPLGIGYRRRGSKNYSDWATGRRKKFDDIFSRVDRTWTKITLNKC